MRSLEKYDRVLTGIISGVMLPIIVVFFIFIFAKGDLSLQDWFKKISLAGVETHIISLCVFPNVLIFLLFNQFDMLRASRGVLGMTIIWAVIVFLIKFLV